MAPLGTASSAPSPARDMLWQHYQHVRASTQALAAPLSIEDQQVQSMPDASPTKWHLGHTAWFFDTVVLAPHGLAVGSPALQYCFNSYYESVGNRQPRPQRGLLTRPSLAEVLQYREQVDHAIQKLLFALPTAQWHSVAEQITLGLHHEQQHQELILMDLKHLFFSQPLRPGYAPVPHLSSVTAIPNAKSQHSASGGTTPPLEWLSFTGGLIEIGAPTHTNSPDHTGPSDSIKHQSVSMSHGFSYDNERPRHRVWLEPYELADRLVTCGEWLAFMQDGGYQRPELWLSDGWAAVQQQDLSAPLYWFEKSPGHWWIYTLQGERPLLVNEPVVHVSYYEADAFARWAQARLPTEAEWEYAATPAFFEATLDPDKRAPLASKQPQEAGRASSLRDPLTDSGHHRLPGSALHPCASSETKGLRQLTGNVWQWTASAYLPYPGFRVAPGIAAEYNGKFMSGQMVLRGGACITPVGHSRPTYRNFFMPQARWAFSGVRLARDR